MTISRLLIPIITLFLLFGLVTTGCRNRNKHTKEEQGPKSYYGKTVHDAKDFAKGIESRNTERQRIIEELYERENQEVGGY